jgi:hypothetical protein
MIKRFQRTLNPACFQGSNNKLPYFEGWYFKIVDADNKNAYAIIPGIFRSKNYQESNAFVQFVDGAKNKAYYIKYPVESFSFKEGKFDLSIDSNHFTKSGIRLDIADSELKVRGELTFENIVAWPVSVLSPGIMGWYAWIPYMECFHGLVSMDHDIDGSLAVNGNEIDFSGGRGYTEKDWGQAFPQAWFWMQSNHFSKEGISFTGSTAIIPWIRKPFLGFIMGLWHEGVLHRFTTYNGSKIKQIAYTDKVLDIVVENKLHQLQIKALHTPGVILKAPKLDGMIRDIEESLNSQIRLKLFKKQKGSQQLIFDDTGIHAGFEAAGDLEKLIRMWDKRI